jgi:26S proteasome non-ATPase regulatory subunit 9
MQLLPQVAQLLGNSEGKAVPTVVVRGGAVVNLTLTPQKWLGRGLLGCHLRPL